MRILILSNLYPPDMIGGYELACSQVVDALQGRHHDVHVLTAAPRLPLSSPCPSHVHRRFQLIEDRYWVEPEGGRDDIFAFLRDIGSHFVNAHNVHILTAALEEFRPDVVYLNNLVGLGGLALLATLQHLEVPWAWHLGDIVPHELCFARRGLIPSLANEFNRGVKGHYIAVSRQLFEEIRGYGFSLDGPTTILPYWITGRREEIETVSAPYVAGSGPLRIMSCGVVNRQKGIDILIEAASLLVESGCADFLIDIYGRIEDATLTALVQRYGLTRQIVFQGPRPHGEITRLYSDYHVFAFPTREREPFGIVPLEAMAAGCVPLITRRCGIAEWLVHGVHCLKVAREPEALAGSLRSILDGEVPLEPIAARGKDLVWNNFHLDTILPRIENVLSSAVREHRRSGSPGSSADAYRLARLAESLAQSLIRDASCA